jgi:uncharacterized protein YecT (DUF1311 family)
MKNNLVYQSLAAFRLLTIASVLTFLNVDSTLAQSQINCDNVNNNVEYKECQHRAYVAADKKLNQSYKRIISGLSGVEKQKLINAQVAWIKFRDNNCDFEVYRNRGGSGYSGFLSECLERMTNNRIKELEDWGR